jgi:hypothetical protein
MPLPPYSLRYSQKAKYLQLRITTRGLEVVVPHKKRVGQSIIEQFLQEKTAWIARHWQRWVEQQEQGESASSPNLPSHIHLAAIEQTWEVSYLATQSQRLTLTTNLSRQIKLLGKVTDEAQCVRLLKQWLKKMAVQELSQQLQKLSVEYSLPFSELTFRHNSTRWGSCSSHKNISLCCNLLFLPAQLVRYVLLHELCHTKMMSHGIKFWRLLQSLDPDCHRHRKELKEAARNVPFWAKN